MEKKTQRKGFRKKENKGYKIKMSRQEREQQTIPNEQTTMTKQEINKRGSRRM